MESSRFEYQKCVEDQSQQACRGRRRYLIIAGVLAAIIIITGIIIVVLTMKSKKEESKTCSTELQCLPITLCDKQNITDMTYVCGNQEDNTICCKPKQVTRTLFTLPNNIAERAAERAAKMEKMSECGIRDIMDKTAYGENATLGELPWMAILGYRDNKSPFTHYNCGGTLINDRYILTAAHCTSISLLTLETVTLGFVDLRNIEKGIECDYDFCSKIVTIPIEKIIRHPNFNSMTLKNDIALLRLKESVSRFNNTDTIRPICLPFNLKFENYIDHKNYSISGWGSTHLIGGTVNNILQVANKFKPWDNDKCNDKLTTKSILPITKNQICAASNSFAEACRGDSGGPLMYEIVQNKNIITIQFGIISYKVEGLCGQIMQPTVFTRVDQYIDWILDNMDI